MCGHEEARHVRSVEDVRSWLSQPFCGTVETAAAPFWRLPGQIRPDVRVLTVRRAVEDVVESLIRTGIAFNRSVLERKMRHLDRKLDQIEKNGALRVDFDDLNTEAVCAKIFEHCLPYRHDPEWWSDMTARNLQISLPALARYEQAHAAQLRRAEAACAALIRSSAWPDVRLGIADASGVSIQRENLFTFGRDGVALFEEHCEMVGEPRDEWTRKNIPLIRRIEDAGAWVYMTARCNGRMLGYLQTLIGPSLEKEGSVSATEGAFFVTRDAKGMNLGMRLQKATIQHLKSRGVAELRMREGVRGSGPKLGVMYRRLGAVEDGNWFRMDLKAA